MKPERIQTKSLPGEFGEQIADLLEHYPEWVLQAKDRVLTRGWKMPSRRASAALVSWLQELAIAAELDPEMTVEGLRVTARLKLPEASEGLSAQLGWVESIEGNAQ